MDPKCIKPTFNTLSIIKQSYGLPRIDTNYSDISKSKVQNEIQSENKSDPNLQIDQKIQSKNTYQFINECESFPIESDSLKRKNSQNFEIKSSKQVSSEHNDLPVTTQNQKDFVPFEKPKSLLKRQSRLTLNSSEMTTDYQNSSKNSEILTDMPNISIKDIFKRTHNKFIVKTPHKHSATSEGNFLIRSATKIKSKLKALSNNIRGTRNESEEIDLLCVNCYEFIPYEKVNSHSVLCIQPKIESDLEFINLNDRIKKLLHAINQRIDESIGDRLLYLLQIQELAAATLNCTDHPNALHSRINSLINSNETNSEVAGSIIFAQRLSNLLEQKSPHFPSRISVFDENSEIKYGIESEIQRKELGK